MARSIACGRTFYMYDNPWLSDPCLGTVVRMLGWCIGRPPICLPKFVEIAEEHGPAIRTRVEFDIRSYE